MGVRFPLSCGQVNMAVLCCQQQKCNSPRRLIFGAAWGRFERGEKAMATFWFCEVCKTGGTIEHNPHIDAWSGIQADRKSTRLNSSHSQISYAVFCLKKKYI